VTEPKIPPINQYPIHTLEAARYSLMQIKYALRIARTEDRRILLCEALNKLYTRWPDLRGGTDEVKVDGR